jgi:DNA-binding MarR family transcriptional regulator
VARREQARAVSVIAQGSAGAALRRAADRGLGEVAGVGRDPLRELPMRLTYRTARVLEVIAQHPGVSNRGVAEQAGISDPGQASKLLARLERLGLAANSGEGHTAGEPNAWRLTATGRSVTQSITAHSGRERAHSGREEVA